MNKPVYFGLSKLELSKILMFEFWYDYANQSMLKNKVVLNGFIVHVKTDDTYKDIAEDVERRFDISNFEIDRPLPK